jgi:hypothetical protein
LRKVLIGKKYILIENDDPEETLKSKVDPPALRKEPARTADAAQGGHFFLFLGSTLASSSVLLYTQREGL